MEDLEKESPEFGKRGNWHGYCYYIGANRQRGCDHMAKTVLIPSDISQPGKDYLTQRGYTIKMGRGLDEKTIMEDAADCDALLARNEHITRAIMEAAPHLKVISKHGVGLDKIDLDAARDLNICGGGGTHHDADPGLRQEAGVL